MPDSRVEAAVANWAPRFVANGVSLHDFSRTTADIVRWAEWLDAWSETAAEHRARAEEAEGEGNERTAGEAYLAASLCYHFAKFVWVLDAGRNRAATELAIECLARAHARLDPAAERLEIPFDGALLAANLRRPPGAARPPLVLLVPGLDSTKEEFFHWEDVFLARGLATLSLDGPGQGESGFATTIRADYEAPVAAVLDALAGRDDLDLDRVGAAGVSLGGYYAPRAAALEPRIRAVAGVSGPFDFGECWEGLPALTRETFQHHSGARDADEARARAHELDLAAVIGELDRPGLMVTGALDRVIPWEQTKRIADEAPATRFVLYEEGNHVCNNIPHLYRPLVADWLRKELANVG